MRLDCTCPDEQLCTRCYGRAQITATGQARVLGQCWAERICRGSVSVQAQQLGRDLTQDARSLVANLTKDARLVNDLAEVCIQGAASWWARRPARYRRG